MPRATRRRTGALVSLAAAALLGACGPAHRTAGLFTPERFVVPVEEEPGPAEVRYATGWSDEPPRPYAPSRTLVRDGVTYARPVHLTEDGWIEVLPGEQPVVPRLWIRNVGLVEQDFTEVRTLTGAVPGSYSNVIRTLPVGQPLERPWRLHLEDLHNVYADYRLDDGDLLLLELVDVDGDAHTYLFRNRDFGVRTRLGAGVLLRLPVPFLDDRPAEDVNLSPALALTLAVGYRPRTRSPAVDWFAEQVALVGSVGIGSTSVDLSPDESVEDELIGIFNAALVGGGVELFEFVSGQVLVNLSSFYREGAESNTALAVGFDAVQFARFFRGAGRRVLRTNELVSPPVPED